jgi:hypothetical protein
VWHGPTLSLEEIDRDACLFTRSSSISTVRLVLFSAVRTTSLFTRGQTELVADLGSNGVAPIPKEVTACGDQLFFHAAGYMQAQQLHRTAVTTSTGLSSNHHTPAPRVFPSPCTDRLTILYDPSPSFLYTTIALDDATGRAIAGPAAQWQTDR